MRVDLPGGFLTAPIAHRGYHDAVSGRPENSRAAVRAAMDAGYGVELDLQLSADGQAMVFHDYDLSRLTGVTGPIRQKTVLELADIALLNGDGEGVPTLVEILSLTNGRVPLLIELKDQDGAMGPDIGMLEAAVARALEGYRGPAAVMSFNPHSVAALASLAPDVPRGLVTSDYVAQEWNLSQEICDRLREIPDFDRTGSTFISHEARDLARPRVQDLRKAGVPILCWTIRSPEEEAEARKYADNVTFEGYPAVIPS